MPRKGWSASSIPALQRHKHKSKGYVLLNGVCVWLGNWPDARSGPPHDVRSEYNQRISEWLANGRQLPVDDVPDGYTVNELIVAFWKHAERHYRGADGKPTSEINEFRYSLKPVVEMYGEDLADGFSPAGLKACRDWFVRNGCCRTLANRRTNRIRRVWRWGVESEMVAVQTHQALACVSPLQAGRCDARETELVEPVEASAVNAAVPHLRPQLAAMVRLLEASGMRPGEVCVMRTCDVDTSGPIWVYSPERHKTRYRGRRRAIYLGPKAQAILASWLKPEAPEAFLFSPAESRDAFDAARRAGRKTPMTPSQALRRRKLKPKKFPRERYDTQSIGHAIAKACRIAGIERWGPGRLRHTFATEVRRKYGLEAAQVLLGHSRADVTQTYALRNETLGMRVAGEIG